MLEIGTPVLIIWPPFDEDELRQMGIGPLTVGTVSKINSRHGNYQVRFDGGLTMPFDESELVVYRGRD